MRNELLLHMIEHTKARAESVGRKQACIEWVVDLLVQAWYSTDGARAENVKAMAEVIRSGAFEPPWLAEASGVLKACAEASEVWLGKED